MQTPYTQQMLTTKTVQRWADYIRRHDAFFILLGTTASVIGIYLPALTAYFISDDFSYVSYLALNAIQLLNGQKWDVWFLAGIDGYLYFRPLGQALMFVDFLIGNQTAFIYHFTNIILHILASYQVYWLSYLITRRRILAGVATMLFVVMPVHAGAVGWVAARYDALAGLWGLASLIFFVLYRQRHLARFYWPSLGAFALGLASKETMLFFPLGILLYDILFVLRKWRDLAWLIAFELPFWILAGLRFILFGRGYQTLELSADTWWRWLDGTLLNLFNPVPLEQIPEWRWLALAGLVILLAVFRFRKELLFSVLWVPCIALATLPSGPSERSFYIPSIGLAIALAFILATLWNHKTIILKSAGVIACLVVLSVYGATLLERNQDLHLAGEIAEAIPAQLKTLHPTLPQNARLVFVGVPDQTPQGTLIYLSGFPGILPDGYAKSSPQFFRSTKFPIWFDRLEQTYFFQVDHRKVIERTDLIETLETRLACSNSKALEIVWDFARDLGGWEAQNQLTDLTLQDGALQTRSWGNDPYMASSPIDVPALSIGDIELEMQVRSDRNQFKGELYWRASGQGDFYPGLQEEFLVQADNQYHVYSFDIAKTGKLNLGDHIQQLRLDPTDGPAEISIKSIRIFVHCSVADSPKCVCVSQ